MSTPTENRLAYERGFNDGLAGYVPDERQNYYYMSGYWSGRAVHNELKS